MARARPYQVYDDNGVYQAACMDTFLAASVVNMLGDGASVRLGRSARLLLWAEGHEEISAGESYDRAAEIIAYREADIDIKQHCIDCGDCCTRTDTSPTFTPCRAYDRLADRANRLRRRAGLPALYGTAQR